MASDTGLRVVTKAVVIVITSLLGGVKGPFISSDCLKQTTHSHALLVLMNSCFWQLKKLKFTVDLY